MNQNIRNTLARRVGPYSVGTWILVLGGGFLLAYGFRKFSGSRVGGGAVNTAVDQFGNTLPPIAETPGGPLTSITSGVVEQPQIEVPFEIIIEPVVITQPVGGEEPTGGSGSDGGGSSSPPVYEPVMFPIEEPAIYRPPSDPVEVALAPGYTQIDEETAEIVGTYEPVVSTPVSSSSYGGGVGPYAI